ncbi:hypothetical protein EI555_014875, partial [Monodon monoceros]
AYARRSGQLERPSYWEPRVTFSLAERCCRRPQASYGGRVLGFEPPPSASPGGEALAGAPLDNTPKEYPPKIQQLVQDIASLTLLEISDLNELLKKTLKIQDVGFMPMGGVVPGAAPAAAAPEAAEEDIPKPKERTHFTVRLTEAKPVDKVKLIKEIKNFVQGINLVQAKKLVESLPQEIKANVAKAEAEKIKAALEAVGGTVVLE